MIWIIVILAFAFLLAWVLEREIFFYEGAHLGPRLQGWLYDRWSEGYDQGKHASQARDNEMLATPLLDCLQDVKQPLILDFATGTGRLSYTLLQRPEFQGHIIAMDLSRGMLEKASARLSHFREKGPGIPAVELLRHRSLPLPFGDGAFDVVCALEVLELFPQMDEPLAELARVLRPGGLLLTSRGTEESGRKSQVKSRADLSSLLARCGLEHVQITPWWKLFDRVLAIRQGYSAPAAGQALSDVLKCLLCGSSHWDNETAMLLCRTCGNRLLRTGDGIILN